MKEWDKFYHEWTAADYYKHIEAVKGFCHRLQWFTPEKGGILEVGIGTGQMSIYLASKNYKVTGIDTNKILIERARRLATEINVKVDFHVEDIFLLPGKMLFNGNTGDSKFNTSFSQGLLEHFEDKDIQIIIENQFKLSTVVGFSVPIDKFEKQSKGDERLLPAEEWAKFVKDYQILHYGLFANETHLMYIVKK